MDFKRSLEIELREWKNKPNRKPLVLRGSRQVGKTTLIKAFSKTYDTAIILNLEKKKHFDYFEVTDSIKEVIDIMSFPHFNGQ